MVFYSLKLVGFHVILLYLFYIVIFTFYTVILLKNLVPWILVDAYIPTRPKMSSHSPKYIMLQLEACN